MNGIHPEKGLINHGDWSCIKNAMMKALLGKDIVTAFIGGSITMGSLSSLPETCYAALVHKWWVNKFPDSNIKYINAGIGGTTSQFGVARVYNDVLCEKPDFVLCEFAVNDENTPFFRETYESLVRVILGDESNPGLLLMNNVMYDSGKSAEEQHLEVAKHYNVPMLSMERTIFSQIKAGTIKASDITPDNLHPNDEGHRLVASVIIEFLEEVYLAITDGEKYVPKTNRASLPSPITQNAYEQSICIKSYSMDDSRYKIKCDGFVPDTEPKKDYHDFFSEGFIGKNVGDSISFSAECTGIAIQYTKTVNKSAPVAKAVIDGDEEHAIILDANFDETWGDCLFIETVGFHLQKTQHEVKITITDSKKNDKSPFYILSVIVSQ